MTKTEEREAYWKAYYAQKQRELRARRALERPPRVLKEGAKAEADRAKAREHYHKKKAKDAEATLANGREHQRQLRIQKHGGSIKYLVEKAIRNVLIEYQKNDSYLKRLEYQRDRNRWRAENDEQYKIETRLRSRLLLCLKRGDASDKKSGPTFDVAGLNAAGVLLHLKAQLKPGEDITNSNIDHIFPLAGFDLENIDEQRKCCNYTNLQPLTEAENKDKSNKLPTKAMAAKVDPKCWPDGVTMDMLPDIYPGWATPLRMHANSGGASCSTDPQ